MIQCVIFDCDGTLVDSEYLCNLGLEIGLRAKGIEEDAQALMVTFRGWQLEKTLARLSARHGVELDETFVQAYRQLLTKLFAEKLQPISGIEAALAAIDLPKCVASGGPMAKIEQALKLTGLSRHFGGNIFSSYVVKSWKPDPDLFLYAARTMGVRPEACAVVEDSPVGIEAALRAGMRPYLYDPHGVQQVAAGEVISFMEMGQLPELIYHNSPPLDGLL
jgi:HAD superfamily hydrolase (TIGR01509 family)